MNYRYMGRTGLKVSELCLGAMTFGRESTEQVSDQVLDRFVEAGGNFIDTANVYGRGTSEEILGRWLKSKRRENFVIASKARFRMDEGPNDEGLSRKHILASAEASLRRLGTDYIDLYQLHAWHERVDLEESLSALNNLVESGKVRYIGASNFRGWQLQKSIDYSRQRRWEAFSCLQPLYNLLDRGIEFELIPICLNEGVGIIPWSPLRGGWLSGKFHRGMVAPSQGTRVDDASKYGWGERWDLYNTERTWSILDVLYEVAQALNKTPAQVALNWLLQRPGITAPIIGARNLQQLEDDLGAVGWMLPSEHLDRLNQVTAVQSFYPY